MGLSAFVVGLFQMNINHIPYKTSLLLLGDKASRNVVGVSLKFYLPQNIRQSEYCVIVIKLHAALLPEQLATALFLFHYYFPSIYGEHYFFLGSYPILLVVSW